MEVKNTYNNEEDENLRLEKPQNLCKQCGRCCRMIAICHTQEELKEISLESPEETRLFTDIVVPYPSIEEAKKQDKQHVENISKVFNLTPDFDPKKLTFYRCPHINEENLCTIYETRPNNCRRAPRTAWSLFPPGCGYEGWQFRERERQKYLVRQLKEMLYDISFVKDENTPVTASGMTKAQAVSAIEEKLKPWEKYGAKEW